MAKSKKEDTEAKVASVAATDQTSPEQVEQTEEQKTASADTSGEAEYDYVVISTFRDKNNPDKTYKVGDSVNRFGEERLNDLMRRRLVERRIKE